MAQLNNITIEFKVDSSDAMRKLKKIRSAYIKASEHISDAIAQIEDIEKVDINFTVTCMASKPKLYKRVFYFFKRYGR